ncbi:MAG TPA: polyprenyl synthetase family protein [Solirubrobacterales bacterium]|nr:polyprenyl synthetase family protein [Solirubrobacterales bacterium]
MNTPAAANGTLQVPQSAAPNRRGPSINRVGLKPAASPLSLSDMHAEVERALAEVEFPAPAGAEQLAEAARYSLLGGGKRVRPILVMACAQALGTPVDRVLPTACAIELIHTNSLIVDDLPAMDNHVKRRGRPTLHRLYGDDIAILAGCALLSEAQRLILEDQPGPAALRNRLLGAVLEATGTAGMVGGQFLDVTKYRPRDREDLERLQMLKTGTLLIASVRCGTLLADNRTVPAFDSFAESLGSLFQVVDDILDETGKARWLGKFPGSDRRAGKMTHVTMFGLRRAKERAKELHEDCLASLEQIASDAPGPTEALHQLADMVLRRKQ